MIAIGFGRKASKVLACLRMAGRERGEPTAEGRIKAARCGRSVVGESVRISMIH